MTKVIADYSGQVDSWPKRYRVEESFRGEPWKAVGFYNSRTLALWRAKREMVDGPAYGFYYRVSDRDSRGADV